MHEMAHGLCHTGMCMAVVGFLFALQYYRVQINTWDILAGFVIFFTIGILTIVFQTREAARANPVDILGMSQDDLGITKIKVK